ncbi:MlaD family protein [Mesorhizobium australicum]|uniref:Phospholipid/cholesterol/gamma-HCH transport system substrate-binding protein n=1 Tax=Mesorhizobium australicum TaxID=536018 RepID=A0A1X7P5H4_9HYPH|nr:MlaD family protein [Mesorhizobium australicum]SMH45148.1 phospholipid/cholesterol/gamma-HCH transport system substrate-binding protein [Mesorhizobium australicum]
METKANYVAVGIFTLVMLLAAFGFVYWTAGTGGGDFATLRIKIPGSASGLGRGSAVLFNGVKVGDVTRIFIDVNDPTVALADTKIDRLTPITKSTIADVGLAGLTGQASIELKGGVVGEENLLALAEANGTVAEITANPSALGNILQLTQNFLTRADGVLSSVEDFVNDVKTPLVATVENAQKFSEALGRNSDNIDQFLASVGDLSKTLSAVSGRLDSTLAAAEDLLKTVDKEKVSTIVSNVETFTSDLKGASDNLEAMMSGVDKAVASITTLSQNATGTLSKVDEIVASVDPATVRSAIDGIKQTTETARKAADDISKVTTKFGNRSEEIDKMISDASQLAERLNAASVRVDGILVKVDNLLGSDNADGLMVQARETLLSFRQVADTLNARMGTITDGLARFSGQGLRDVEALVRDSRRSVNRIEEVISDLGRNPQRIIAGGEGEVRQYDGRVRR